MQSININVEDEQKIFLETLPNYSGWIRDAIEEKRGRRDKSLAELIMDSETLSLSLMQVEKKIGEYIERQLEHKENLKLSEIDEFNKRKAEQEESERQFKEEYAYLDSYPQVKTLTEEQLKDTKAMIDLCELLAKDGHRVGISQLRKFITIRSNQEEDQPE